MTRKEMREGFIRELAEQLVGTNAVKMSIRLQTGIGKADAEAWARLRGKTPLFGYPTVDEAVETLTEFLK